MCEVSVIVPFYNPPKLRFRKCIESLLDQCFQDYEIILVDDGNSQEVLSIAQEYAKNSGRIRLIQQENSGVSAGRNVGIENANGKYISFVDADDFVEYDYLHKLYKAIQDSDISICGLCEQFYPMDDGWEDSHVFFSMPNEHSGLQYINFSVNKMYKTDILKKYAVHFPVDVKLGEDALFLAKYFEHCFSIRCIPDLLYHYVPNEKSAVHKYCPEYWSYEADVIEKQWDLFNQYALTKNQRQGFLCWLFRKYRGVVCYYLDNENNKQHTRDILKSVFSHQLFLLLNDCDLSKKNLHLSSKEKLTIRIWRRFGVEGAIWIHTVSKIRH